MLDGLRVRLIGEFRIDGLDIASLRSRQARRLVKRLALHAGSVVDPDRLIDAVWGEQPPTEPMGDLSVLVSRARGLIGSDRLVRRDGGYALLADWTDRDEFSRLAIEATRRHGAGDLAGTRAATSSALALVRGPLLVDEGDADWVVPARVAMQISIGEVRHLAASSALDAGLLADAVGHARAALADDPYDERAIRTLMAAHAGSGRSASALAVYADLRRRLAEELGVDPSTETEGLHTSILLSGTTPGIQRASTSATFVGRAHELAMLDDALRHSQSAAEVVVVTGEPGIGSSSLLVEWTARARAQGALVLTGTARAGVDLALHPVIDALADLSRTAPDIVGDRAVSGLRPPERGAVDAALQRSMFDEVARLIDAVRPSAGVAVVLDDAHLADVVTIEWIAHVLNHRGEHRVLVVAGVADGEDSPLPSSMTIRLAQFDRHEAAQLVSPQRVDELWPLTSGNPLLLVELANRRDDGSIPPSIRDAVAERLRRAGPAAATLRAAAVLGSTVDLDLLAGVLGRSPLELLDHLDEGVRRAFLAEQAGELVFRHELVRQAVANDANVARRTFLHREAARWLAARPAPTTVADALEVARHARSAGDAHLACEFLVTAARLARDRVDLSGAESLLDDAIALHDEARARLIRSRVRMARGNLMGADDDAAAALALGAGAEALELRAWAARNRHDMASAIRLGRAGVAASSDPSTTASCLMAVAFAHRGTGDLRATDALLGEARALDLTRTQSIDAWTGVLRVHQGRPDEALASLEPLLGSAPGDLHSFWVEHVLQMTAHAYGLVGRVGDAFAMLDRLEVELERRGTTVRYVGVVDTYRSWLLRGLASPDATDTALRAIEHAASSEIRGQAHLDLAEALERGGRHAEAAVAMQGALDEMGTRWFHNRWRCEQRAGLIQARLHLADGDAQEALASASTVSAAAHERGDLRYSSMARVCVTIARLRLGQDVDASAALADIGIVARVAVPEAWWMAADLADAIGDARGGLAVRRIASDVGAFLVAEAGPRGQHLTRALANRVG